MIEQCPRCNMRWGDPHNCYPPAQLVAAEARLAALRPLARAAVALDNPVEDAIGLIEKLATLGRAVRALPVDLRHELAGAGHDPLTKIT
jgi:hypothetical protein